MWLSERGGKNPKSVWWNDDVKAAIRKNEPAEKDVLECRDEDAKERFIEVYRKKRERLKGAYIRGKKEVNKQLGRNMNQNFEG